MSTHQQSLTTYINAFVSELINNGIEDVVISPGSRSTPIAMLMAENDNFNIHVQIDERSAAFFALGIAKVTKKPTVILCTSGTAAANYYPAIIEANLSRVPLIVLTADRPHELRDVGAPQAIDQISMYGSHVKKFYEMPLPNGSEQLIRYVRSICGRAIATTINSPAGPVHLNFPLREPLIPLLDCEDPLIFENRNTIYTNVETGQLSLSEQQFEHLSSFISKFKKGLIVCGPFENNNSIDEITKLAEQLQFPVIADPLSGLRSGSHSDANLITSYDSFLKDDKVKKYLQPEVIIRFGAMPVSKSYLQFMQMFSDIPQVIVDKGEGWRDPSLTAAQMVYCDEALFCENIIKRSNKSPLTDWLSRWKDIDKLTIEQLAAVKSVPDLSESKLFAVLNDVLPNDATIFVSNSMPIRDADTFFTFNDKNISVIANRGANGIDGVVSTALGVAVKKSPVYLVVGDLTFFHDLNGLLLAKHYGIDLKVILINNNGGGIFSFLPQAKYENNFELLFGTPLNIDFSHAIEMYGGKYYKPSNWDDFNNNFQEITVSDGLNVLEVVTNRDDNLTEHRNLWKNVSREIDKYMAANND